MARRSDSSLVALLLTQRFVDARTEPLKGRDYWALLTTVPDPGTLLGLDAAAIADRTGVDLELADRIAGRLDAVTTCAFALDDFEHAGMQVLTSFDEGYPAGLVDRLGVAAPPALYCAGDVGLLSGDLLGVVGSRDVGDAGAEVAVGVAREAAQHGLGIVSGGAKGVDRLAMNAALEAGTTVVGVLADSLVRAIRDAQVRSAVADGLVCLCTPFKPTAGFSPANAMARNKVIYGLSKATLVVAAEEERGGTWSGAVEAIRRGFAPVLVWVGEGAPAGNARLTELGARAIGSLGEVVRVVDALAEPGDGPATIDAEQLRLGV